MLESEPWCLTAAWLGRGMGLPLIIENGVEADDVVVKLDTKRKKLIGDSAHSDNAAVFWEDDLITWWPKYNSKISNTSFELNRYSGQLIVKTITNNSGSSTVDGITNIKFNCSKTNKMF